MSFLTNIQLGSPTQPGIGFTVNRYVNAGTNKLVLNGTGTNIFEITTGAGGLTRRFAFASSGQYTMDAYGTGTFTGTATKWLAVTSAGIVIEEDPPTGSGGTLTNFSFTDANGFDGTVTNPTTTPNLTLTTTLTQGSVFFAGTGGAINEDNTNFFFNDTSNTLGIGTNSFTATRLEIVDNGLGAASMVKLTSASTAASGNAHKLLEILPSGANANSGSTTYGIYVENTHTGSSSTNIGIQGIANSGNANIGVLGTSSAGSAVNGVSTSGTGVIGQSDTGRALRGETSAGLPCRLVAFPSSTNTVVEVLRLNRQSSGTGANGIGASLTYYLETSSGGTSEQLANELISKYTDNIFASRTAQFLVTGYTDADLHDQLAVAGPQSILYSRDAGTNQTDYRYSVIGTYKALTESSATAFVRISVPSGTATGGEILITVEANDATDYQSRTLRFIWSAVNKAGTITATVQTPEEAVAVSAGTLTVTIDTNDAGSGNLDFRANVVSSLTQTVLRCSYQVFKNIGNGAITPQ